MPLLHLALVALIQGVTEFLPVSSSGHLILLPALTGIRDQGLAIDVAVHVGTLGAVMLYFRRDCARLLRGVQDLLAGRTRNADARLLLLLALATVPVVLAGLIIKLAGFDAALRSARVIGVSTLVFGILLWVADRLGAQRRQMDDWTWGQAWTLGLWQVLALVPGTSRSGITITGARFLGFERHEAVRIAMLMSIPTILASGVLLAPDVIAGPPGLLADAMLGAGLALIAALAALHFMIRFLDRVSFTPYVIYRVILGSALILWSFG